MEEQALAFRAGHGGSTERRPNHSHRWSGLRKVSALVNFAWKRVGGVVGINQWRQIRRLGTHCDQEASV